MQKKEKAQRASCCTHDLIHRLKGRSLQEAASPDLSPEGCRQAAGFGKEGGDCGKGQAEAQQ